MSAQSTCTELVAEVSAGGGRLPGGLECVTGNRIASGSTCPQFSSESIKDSVTQLGTHYSLEYRIAEMKQTLAFLGLWGVLTLMPSSKCSPDVSISEKFALSSLWSSIQEAKQMVDEAYKFSRERAKEDLKKSNASPSDFLKHLKEPVAGTRTAIRSAAYQETIFSLLQKKLEKYWHRHFNITDMLSDREKEIISRATGCDYLTRPMRCPETNPYRTITGECNNRKHPHFGASNHGYARWLPAEYEDGKSLPQGLLQGKLHNGYPLPLVREVSNEIIATSNENITDDQERSLAFMQWGQWVDHDMDLAPMTQTNIENKESHCSTSCNYAPPCFPIQFPPGDPRRRGPGFCMPFIRTAPVCNPTTLVREQINAITSFLDASMVYGSEEPLAKSLRNRTNCLGLMALNQNFTDKGLGLLPFENNSKSLCLFTNKTDNIPCFIAGDKRVTENLGLTAIHTLFVREHNRLATELKRLNPHWDGEKLYQETRKIIGAVNQVITFRDYLPLVLGNVFNKQLPLYKGYDDTVDPTVANVFSLAFRFGHGSIPPLVSRLGEDFKPLVPYSYVPLHLTFCASWRIIREGGIDPLLRGFLADHSKLMKQSQMMVEELQDRLFEQVEEIGLDLAALNLQRGRDHGLPGYNAWRRLCGLSQPRNEAELAAVLRNPKLAKKFIDLYGTPDNIDIWIGSMAEPFVPNGRVGPLLACLIGKQFRHIRDGDRFWWENRGVFTRRQRRILSSASLSRIICDNTHIKEVPMDIFKRNQYPRDFVNCRRIKGLDLSAWKE
ncbi:eosinophil peroxidase-like [Eublepharis macularius]|uniref:Eosinophil peroxidase-like n=1 Tax=Eublepharis macularius TaxID=481883 RepID=A0AA97LIR1_EUBMA|nr:eosinophil peroxidase-like [Eublepharis macularius]